MKAEPQKEHEWLHQLVGEWTYEAEARMGPDEPTHESTGTETVRSLGGLWVIAEGQGTMPDDGAIGHTVMTLGYDPETERFVGTWIGSMMTHFWIYEGHLDDARRVLTLDCEGPAMTAEGAMAEGGATARYQDVLEILAPDHRTLSSQVLGEDGEWNRFMTAHYRRTGR